MGNISFMDAVKYVLKSFGRVPSIIIGNVGNVIANISTAISGLSKTGTHMDVSANEDKVYSSLASNFWMSAAGTVVSIIISIITFIFSVIIGGAITEDITGALIGGGLGGIFSIILSFSSLISTVVYLVVASLIIYFGHQYSKKLNMVLVKILIVLCFVSIVGSAISTIILLISAIFSLFTLSIGDLITNIVYVLVMLTYISNYGAIAGALGSGNGYGESTNTNSFDNNNYGNTIDINKNSDVNNSNVQMYACPYCGKAIYQNQSPCPHCNQAVNW